MLSLEHRKKVESIYRYVKPWFDPTSYRPLILLFVVAMAIFLWPLATEVASALFFRIPNPLRRAMINGLLLSLLGLAFYRLWQVKPRTRGPRKSIAPMSCLPRERGCPGAAGRP